MAADETIKQLAKQRLPLVSHEAEKGICLVQAAPPDTQYYNMLQYCWHKMLQVLPPCYKYTYNLQTMTGWPHICRKNNT